MKDRDLSPEQAVLESILKETGIPIHRGGFRYNPVDRAFTIYPVLDVSPDSELPTENEIKTLREIGHARTAKYYPEYVDGFYVEGATTVTFRKQNGQWNYHLATWQDTGAWSSKPGPLDKVSRDVTPTTS